MGQCNSCTSGCDGKDHLDLHNQMNLLRMPDGQIQPKLKRYFEGILRDQEPDAFDSEEFLNDDDNAGTVGQRPIKKKRDFAENLSDYNSTAAYESNSKKAQRNIVCNIRAYDYRVHINATVFDSYI